MIDRKKLIRWSSLAAYFVAAFLVFLVYQLPFDRIKNRLESEVRSATPLELSIGRISPRFLNRFSLQDVVLKDGSGRVLLESPSVRAHVSLFNFLRGLLAVTLDGKVYGGELSVRSRRGGKMQYLSLDATDIDIASYPLLKDLGIRLSGRLGGSFEMTNDAGRGKLWIKGLTSRQLAVKGFPVPDLDFEQCWIEADIKGDRCTIRKLELDGKELKVRISGDVVMNGQGALNLAVKLKPSERLAREQAGLLSLVKNKDAEGFYQFSLAGTVANPLPRL